MKAVQFIIYLFITLTFSQNKLALTVIDSLPLKASSFLGVDVYKNIFFINNNILYKKTSTKLYSYKNFSLGEITTVDFLNPLAVNVFYKDVNVTVQLDKKLTELKQYNFNFSEYSFIKTASNHRLWGFNQNNQQIEIFNLKTRKIEAKTQIINSNIIDIVANYNYCWVLTELEILKYNSYGSLVKRYNVSRYTKMINSRYYFLLQKENELFLFNKKEESLEKLKINKIVIKDFSLLNETVYIYDGKKMYTYKINYKNK